MPTEKYLANSAERMVHWGYTEYDLESTAVKAAEFSRNISQLREFIRVQDHRMEMDAEDEGVILYETRVALYALAVMAHPIDEQTVKVFSSAISAAGMLIFDDDNELWDWFYTRNATKKDSDVTEKPASPPAVYPERTAHTHPEVVARIVRGVYGLVENQIIQFPEHLAEDSERWNTVIKYLEGHLAELDTPIGGDNKD